LNGGLSKIHQIVTLLLRLQKKYTKEIRYITAMEEEITDFY